MHPFGGLLRLFKIWTILTNHIMKNGTQKPMNAGLVLIIFLSILTMGCSTRTAPVQLMRPADVNLPHDVVTIVTVDRSKPSSGFWNVVEGLFTGEAIGQDREGRRRAIESLRVNMTRTPRFKVMHSNLELTGSRSGSVFPEYLSWQEIEEICQRYQADALVALELFDSDTPMWVRTEKKKDKEGNQWKEFIVDQDVVVRTGWRVYDPVNRVVLDEYVSSANRRFSGRGRDSMQVIRARRWQLEDVRAIAFASGEAYTMRLAPVWITESRMYYVKAKGVDKATMKTASNLVKIGKWNDAINLWENILDNSSNAKTSGRAAYNLAVAHEMLGDFDTAIKWCEVAFIQYRNKAARTYLQRLKKRQFDEYRLDDQLR
jgi:tetratricopeptide (TPR) repeat protein